MKSIRNLLVSVAWIFPLSALAQPKVPAGFAAVPIAAGLNHPTALAFAPDGRLFVCEKPGRLRVMKGGAMLDAAFAAVPALLRGDDGEAGLLGVAVHPRFADSPYVYVFYTASEPYEHNRISRFKAAGDVGDKSEGEVVILDFPASGGWNHNGGAIHFGPDGKLYAAHGDAANNASSQSMSTLHGKIIRLNPVPDSAAQIPSDNPFYSTASGRNRLIWALGLRNPYTFAFQGGPAFPGGLGRMFINDVGQSTFEEINEGRAGANYGWSAIEGPFAAGSRPGQTPPILAYKRTTVGNATGAVGDCIVGGAFYNPAVPTFPAEYRGKYFFGDHPWDSWMRYIDPDNPGTTLPFATDTDLGGLVVGPDGALYYTDHEAGSVVRIQYGPSAVMPASRSARLPGPKLVFDDAFHIRVLLPSRGIRSPGRSDLRGRLVSPD